MSNLIYEGDIIANFGKYLPTPYIESIIISEDEYESAVMTVNLVVHVDASIYADDTTLEEQIKKLNFYWMWSDTLLEDNQFVFDLADLSGEIANVIRIDNDTMVDAGIILYDSEGNRIIKYAISSEITLEKLALSGGFPPVLGAMPMVWTDVIDLYAYAFSTSEDLSEDYWNPSAEGYPILERDDHWREFFKNETSDVAYEQVMSQGLVPDPTETIWVDENDAAYADIPHQAITGLYYKSNRISHEEIVESFQDLVAEYQEQSETDSHLKDVLDNISYILEIYGTDVDLLLRLNEFRRAFPSKTSATSVGQVYLKYRKKIYTANSVIELDEQVYKKVVANSKIIDARGYTFAEFEGLDLEDACGEGGDCLGDCELVSNFTFDRQYFNYAPWGVTALGVVSNYGFFFFDYELASAYLSNIAAYSGIDAGRIKELWGDDIFNLSFQLSEVKLERYEEQTTDGGITMPDKNYMDMTGYYTYDRGYPEQARLDHTFYCTGTPCSDEAGAGYAEVVESFETDEGTSSCTAKSFLTLRNFDLVPIEDSPLSDYGLMCFEFQDLMAGDYAPPAEPAANEHFYRATITIEDTTLDIIETVVSVFGDFATDFYEYWEAANEPCAYNSIDGTFNDYFIDWASARWPVLATSPWVMAPAIYYMYLDLLEGAFGGDVNLIALLTQLMSSAISPSSGTLTQLNEFEALFSDLQELIDALSYEEGDIGEYETTKEFSCTHDFVKNPWLDKTESGTMCDLVHTSDFTYEGAAPAADDYGLGAAFEGGSDTYDTGEAGFSISTASLYSAFTITVGSTWGASEDDRDACKEMVDTFNWTLDCSIDWPLWSGTGLTPTVIEDVDSDEPCEPADAICKGLIPHSVDPDHFDELTSEMQRMFPGEGYTGSDEMGADNPSFKYYVTRRRNESDADGVCDGDCPTGYFGHFQDEKYEVKGNHWGYSWASPLLTGVISVSRYICVDATDTSVSDSGRPIAKGYRQEDPNSTAYEEDSSVEGCSMCSDSTRVDNKGCVGDREWFE